MLYLRRSGLIVVFGRRLAVLVAAAVLLIPGCEDRVSEGGATALERAVGPGDLLTIPTGPTKLTAAAGYRVSPAWSPSGRWLAVAGLRGQGLYLLPADGGPERVVDADFRGPWRWQRDGARDVLCFGSGPSADALDAETWEVRPVCAPDPYDADRGVRIHSVGGRTFYHSSRLGTVTLVRGESVQTFPLDHGAWGAKVSPDGRFVAYCAGNLAKAELIVLDVAAGRTRSLGSGAHPAWFPDSTRLVYTTISRIKRQGRAALVTAAALRLYEVATGQSRDLKPVQDQTHDQTRVPALERAQVQPAVSPDSRIIAYADWRSGAIYLMPAPGQVAP